jgi:RecB family endonuclease NucS
MNECQRDNIRRSKGRNYDRLYEADIEQMLSKDVSVIEQGMTFIASQYRTKCGVIDVLTEDANGQKCIIEIKDNGKDERIVFQCINYPKQFHEPVRMITLCPDYSPKIREALKSLGHVELKRFDIKGKELVVFDDKSRKITA